MVLNWALRRLNRHDHGSAMALNEFFDGHYYPYIRSRKEKPYYDRIIYKNHIRDSLGGFRMDAIKKATLELWLQGQLEAGLKNATVNKHICLVNKILKTASEWEHLPNYNPDHHALSQLRLGQLRQRFLNHQEIEEVLNACATSPHPFLKFFIQILLLTGARSGEALGAKWRDLDWENAIWTVPKSKNGKTRFIYLNASAVSVFRQIQQKTRRMNLPVTSASPVFTNPKSKKAYKSFHLAWYAVREQLGLEDVRIHDLRHTYASLLVNKGVSLYEVQQLLGHSSAQMTQRYAHLAPNTLHRRTEIVAQIINPGLR